MFGANKNRAGRKNNSHLILICDDAGIFDAFKLLKLTLGGRLDTFLTLIYVIPENILYPLFERELRILGDRFSSIFFVYSLKIKPGAYELIQESIEAIINSNINLKMHFSVFGNEEFVIYVTGVLEYININTCSYSIESAII
jgi:hypothetical protein